MMTDLSLLAGAEPGSTSPVRATGAKIANDSMDT
jgi:hypothetical protein